MIESITVTSLLAVLFSHVIYHIVGHNANEALIQAIDHLKKGGKPVNHDLQKALKRSKLSAFRQMAQECSEELVAESPRTASRHDLDWLTQKTKQLEMELGQVDHATPEEGIFDSLDKITALLTSEDRLTTQRRELTQQLIHEALGDKPAPTCYETKVKEEIFEYVCVHFANEIKETPTVRHIFDAQVLAQIAAGQKEIQKRLSRLEKRLLKKLSKMEAMLVRCLGEYLANPTKAYQEGYQAITHLETEAYTVPRGKLPSIDSIKQQFNLWFDDHRPFLRERICEVWQRLQLSPSPQSDDPSHLIVALATDVVLEPLVHPKHNVVIITLLVTNGYLDKLCVD